MKKQGIWKTGAIITCLLVMALFLFANGAYAAEKTGSKVLARIGAVEITEADVEARIEALPPVYGKAPDESERKKAIVEKLVNFNIFAQEARAEKLDQDKTVKMKLDDMANSLLAREYMKKKRLMAPEVSREEAEKYYKEHESEFVKGPSVKISEILVKADQLATKEQAAKAREKAEKMVQELKKGADFAQLAMKYSDDERTASQGGSLGYLTKEQMPPEVAKAAFAMKTGGISDPIKTAQGFYVIKVEDRKETVKEGFEEARKRIVPKIVKEKERDLIQKETERLKKKYNVKMYVEEASGTPAGGKK